MGVLGHEIAWRVGLSIGDLLVSFWDTMLASTKGSILSKSLLWMHDSYDEAKRSVLSLFSNALFCWHFEPPLSDRLYDNSQKVSRHEFSDLVNICDSVFRRRDHILANLQNTPHPIVPYEVVPE